MRIWIAICFVFSLVACDGDRFEFELPVNEPRLVVNFVSLDSQPWKGTLTQSLPILELQAFQGVPGAALKIYEDGNLIETVSDLPHDASRSLVAATTNRPAPGKTYTIEATAPGYATALGIYVQPLPVSIEKYDVRLVGPDPDFQNQEAIEFSVTFVDPPNENYYSIDIRATWDSVHINGGYYELKFIDPVYQEYEPYDRSFGKLYFDDAYFAGQRVTLRFKARAQKSHLTNRREDWFEYSRVMLGNVSRSYYRYLKTIDLQSKGWGDPYAQPVKVETNVKNGFGVVGGYTGTLKIVPFID
jgi:hypothetical protein